MNTNTDEAVKRVNAQIQFIEKRKAEIKKTMHTTMLAIEAKRARKMDGFFTKSHFKSVWKRIKNFFGLKTDLKAYDPEELSQPSATYLHNRLQGIAEKMVSDCIKANNARRKP